MITATELREYQKKNQQDEEAKKLALELIEMDLKQAAKNNLNHIVKRMASSSGVQQALFELEAFGGYELEILSQKAEGNGEAIKFKLSW